MKIYRAYFEGAEEAHYYWNPIIALMDILHIVTDFKWTYVKYKRYFKDSSEIFAITFKDTEYDVLHTVFIEENYDIRLKRW